MYAASAPSYEYDKEKKEWDESIDANNPCNFAGGADEEEVIY